jgi:hypothetical protein
MFSAIILIWGLWTDWGIDVQHVDFWSNALDCVYIYYLLLVSDLNMINFCFFHTRGVWMLISEIKYDIMQTPSWNHSRPSWNWLTVSNLNSIQMNHLLIEPFAFVAQNLYIYFCVLFSISMLDHCFYCCWLLNFCTRWVPLLISLLSDILHNFTF